MVRDDRLYAFIVARTSRSRSQIRRICVHKRWLKLSAFLVLAILGAALYGLYGLTQHAMHLRVEHENDLLRFENERQRQQLNDLNRRVQAVEDTSRRLVEMSGVAPAQQTELPRGAGGPSLIGHQPDTRPDQRAAVPREDRDGLGVPDDLCCQRFAHDEASAATSRSPSPTPGGVPVEIISPASRVMNCER